MPSRVSDGPFAQTRIRFSFRGTAGAISYALWELGFWGVSLPVCIVGYQQATGHWPDFGDVEDQKKIAAEAFAFVNFARLAVPLRIGLALSTVSFATLSICACHFSSQPDTFRQWLRLRGSTRTLFKSSERRMRSHNWFLVWL